VVIGPDFVRLADQKAARQDVLEAVRARRGRLEREVVERPRVLVALASRQAVVDREVELRLVGLEAGRRDADLFADAAAVADG